MLKIKHYIPSLFIISICSLIFGIIFFCFYQELIIVSFQNKNKNNFKSNNTIIKKKISSFHFWKLNKWHKESIEILWSNEPKSTITTITNQYFSLLDEEEILNKKILVQTVSLSQSEKIVYLSLDRYPFERETSTFEKLMIIEGLLKTLKDAPIKVLSFQFLVHHELLKDYHLDFTNPWPLCGLIQ